MTAALVPLAITLAIVAFIIGAAGVVAWIAARMGAL